MNFKIEHLTNFNNSRPATPSITFLPNCTSLVVYGHQKPVQQQQVPAKKTIKFKADKSAQTAQQKISIYCIQSNTWTSKQVKGKIPSVRFAHKMLYLHPCLILFGGKSFATPAKLFNDLYALNLETWTWKKLFSLEGPPAFQNYHMAKLSDTKLILIGKQVWTLSIKDVKWQLNASQLPGAVWEKINVQMDTLLIGVAVKSQNQILIFQEGGIVNSLLLNKKMLNEENAMKLDRVLIKNQEAGIIDFYSFFNDEQSFLMVNGDSISSYTLQKNSQEIEILDQQAIKEFKIQTIDSHLNSLYIMTDKAEIYHIDCSQLKTQRKVYDSPNNVSSKQLVDNNSCIVEESHQSSAYYSKQNQNEDRNSDFQGTQRPSLQKAGSRILVSKRQSQKFVNECNQNSNDQDEESQEERGISTFQEDKIKSQLGTLLAYEHFKRKISQTKSRVLEHAIKRSEKMVLTLCQYGNQKDKRKHIEKVKLLRQQLQQVWGKQIYYRKQIQNRQSDICMEKLLEENLNPTYSQYLN